MLAVPSAVAWLWWGAAMQSVPWTWEAPTDGCPAAADVQRAIERYANRPLAQSDITARARVVPLAAGGFRLKLMVLRAGTEGESTSITDPDCAVLADAAALKIATAMLERDPGPDLSQPPPDDPSAATPRAAPQRCRPGQRQTRASHRGLASPCGLLQLSSTAQWGPLPRVSAGLAAEAGLLWRRVRLQAGVRFWFPQVVVQREGTREATFRMLVGAALGCPRLGAGSFEFPVCAGIEVGSLHGAGSGVANPRIDRLVWVAGLVRAGVAWAPHARVALFVLGELAIPVADYRFELARALIHEPALVGGRVGGGVELRLFTREEKNR